MVAMEPTFDLAVNLPPRLDAAALLDAHLSTTRFRPDDLAYPDTSGPLAAREAIARWLSRVAGLPSADPQAMTTTLGARHALGLALAAAVGGGAPSVLVEDHTFQGFRAIARGAGIRCVDVAMDRHGMRPDAMAEAAARGTRAIYLQPTLQNPTTVTMPLSRRQEIVDAARALDLVLIEGDVYSPLASQAHVPLPALASLAPERTFHAGGIGKVLGPGLRVGWLLHPDATAHAATAATLQRDHDGLPALWPCVVARCMDDGSLDAHLTALARATTARGELARRIVGEDLVVSGTGLHAWLPDADAPRLERRLLDQGVRVAASAHFVAEGRVPAGIRLALGAEGDIARLAEALRIVAAAR